MISKLIIQNEIEITILKMKYNKILLMFRILIFEFLFNIEFMHIKF